MDRNDVLLRISNEALKSVLIKTEIDELNSRRSVILKSYNRDSHTTILHFQEAL